MVKVASPAQGEKATGLAPVLVASGGWQPATRDGAHRRSCPEQRIGETEDQVMTPLGASLLPSVPRAHPGPRRRQAAPHLTRLTVLPTIRLAAIPPAFAAEDNGGTCTRQWAPRKAHRRAAFRLMASGGWKPAATDGADRHARPEQGQAAQGDQASNPDEGGPRPPRPRHRNRGCGSRRGRGSGGRR